jgi:hypothetical protein
VTMQFLAESMRGKIPKCVKGKEVEPLAEVDNCLISFPPTLEKELRVLSEKARIISLFIRRCVVVVAVTMSGGVPEKKSSTFGHSSVPCVL